jgi:hypothetical protein
MIALTQLEQAEVMLQHSLPVLAWTTLLPLPPIRFCVQHAAP